MQINRSKKLINNIQILSDIEEKEFVSMPINLKETLSDAIQFIRESFSNSQIEIVIEQNINEIYVNGNELLNDVFENILLNAINYNEKPIPEILIKISRIIINKINYIKIEFIDNGIGIPDSRKEKIFERGDKQFKGKKGMGLGFSLVLKIIKMFNGKVRK